MNRSARYSVAIVAAIVVGLSTTSAICAQQKKKAPKVKVSIALSDAFMGDYQGTITSATGKTSEIAAQVMAQGDGDYTANLIDKFDTRRSKIAVIKGHRDGSVVRFDNTARIENDKFTGTVTGTTSGTFEMKKVVRLSPTLGAKPPKNALVLFDGTSLDQWLNMAPKTGKTRPCKWKLLDNGAMEVVPGTGWAITKRKFGNFKLHIEFRVPLVPKGRGQARGNSGVYLQGRYEIQILDSYGLEGEDNECGGIYKVSRPRVNMCSPPLQWQTYDIEFESAVFDPAGTKLQAPHITVLHNGFLIHERATLPGPTHVAPFKESPEPGPIVLQDHGWPVQFRNIWIVEE